MSDDARRWARGYPSGGPRVGTGAHRAGCRRTPAGTSPVVTMRHQSAFSGSDLRPWAAPPGSTHDEKIRNFLKLPLRNSSGMFIWEDFSTVRIRLYKYKFMQFRAFLTVLKIKISFGSI